MTGKAQTNPDLPEKSIWQKLISRDPFWMGLLALGWLVLLTLLGIIGSWQYGFHRDELNFIENARHLDWGYVEYPPLAPFVGRLIIDLFGISPVALRFAAALIMTTGIWLTGMMAYSLGGGRRSQALAMLAAAVAPLPITNMRFFSYQTFDYLWWVLTAYLIIRLVQTNDPRWWLAIGAVLGLGMMTKYSIPFLIAGIVAGVLLTPTRQHLKSPWLWAGAALSVVFFLPNLIWMVQHDMITLDFQTITRARNLVVGRTDNFLIQQLYSCTNPASVVDGGIVCAVLQTGKQTLPDSGVDLPGSIAALPGRARPFLLYGRGISHAFCRGRQPVDTHAGSKNKHPARILGLSGSRRAYLLPLSCGTGYILPDHRLSIHADLRRSVAVFSRAES